MFLNRRRRRREENFARYLVLGGFGVEGLARSSVGARSVGRSLPTDRPSFLAEVDGHQL